MTNQIIEASQLPETEKVYLRKGYDGWRVVYPIKNEDGSFNWFNFITGGSWYKLVYLGILVLIILGVFYEYSSNLAFCKDLLSTRFPV